MGRREPCPPHTGTGGRSRFLKAVARGEQIQRDGDGFICSQRVVRASSSRTDGAQKAVKKCLRPGQSGGGQGKRGEGETGADADPRKPYAVRRHSSTHMPVSVMHSQA